jgi:glycosyltransferase involved in cell wall biosynthesis
MTPQPFVSIVSGTYNRLSHLQAMMNSARLALPLGLPYEFVIVDGGSTDGTLEWLSEQPDARVIEHGELLGAIKAFCDGAFAAQGEYVLLANDDVTFHPESIAAALAYIEDRPTCGSVAFADNRPVRGYRRDVFKTQIMQAVDPDGHSAHVVYAQVGLFRKWLGDWVGWWGTDDPIMGKARTYGGDNYLSARIWETGYSIDTLPLARVSDHVVADGLRAKNVHQEGAIHEDSQAFYEVFPKGPQLRHGVNLPNNQQRKLRILYLPIYEAGHTGQQYSKRGLRLALKRVGIVYEVDYLNTVVNLAQVVKAWQPDLVLSQLHSANHVTANDLLYWRTLCPQITIVNWNGDARDLTNDSYMDLLREVDLQLVVNAAPLDAYEREGIRAAYWQIGYEEPQTALPDMPAHDVVFLGNCYNAERRALEGALSNLNGHNVGLYGSGWQAGQGNTLYNFAAGESLYQRSAIAISDTFPGTQAFVSNRLFQALAAGAFVLQQHIPDIEAYTGLTPGEHFIEWHNVEDLPGLINDWMDGRRATRRERIATAGRDYVRENYSFDAQVRKLFTDLLPLIVEPVTEPEPEPDYVPT